MTTSKKIRTFAAVVLLIVAGTFIMSTSAQEQRATESFQDERVDLTTNFQELDGADLSNVQTMSNVTVSNVTNGNEYTLGDDYELDRTNVSIRRLSNGTIAPNEEVSVDYTVEHFTDEQQWGVASGQTIWGIAAFLILVVGAAFLLAATRKLVPSGGGNRRGGTGR